MRNNSSIIQKIHSLGNAYPLPKEWKKPLHYYEKLPLTQESDLHLFGFATKSPSGVEITASSADLTSDALVRAYFELLERVALVQTLENPRKQYPVINAKLNEPTSVLHSLVFPKSKSKNWEYSKSNGVAAHTNIRRASRAAILELLERDTLLRSWYGLNLPRKVEVRPSGTVLNGISKHYYIEFYSFEGESLPAGTQISGVFCFPRNEKFPFLCGFGASNSLEDSLFRACRECLQRYGFTLGEKVLKRVPPFSKTAGYHLDYYLRASSYTKLKDWLRGCQNKYEKPTTKPTKQGIFAVDITPYDFTPGVRIAKAISADRIPLVFGYGNPKLSMSSIPQELMVHPFS